ncbi:hypothetical protein HC766_03205 [Candidatus Gracilibacteria bacterium]|nr:hypothetical protein [Candidatus Gracilibacteria bacterium]
MSEFGIFAREQGVMGSNPRANKNNNSLAKPRISDLRALSKDEILNRYFKDTQSLENQIEIYQDSLDDQTEVIVNVKDNVKKLLDEFEEEKTYVQKQLEKELQKLERKYNPGLFRRLLFFIPKMSDKEFKQEYQSKVDQYSKKYSDLNVSFFRLMLTSYGDGLNRILMKLPNNIDPEEMKSKNNPPFEGFIGLYVGSFYIYGDIWIETDEPIGKNFKVFFGYFKNIRKWHNFSIAPKI